MTTTHLNAYDLLIADKAVKREIDVGEFMCSPVSICPYSDVLAILTYTRDVAINISEQSWTRDVDAFEHTYVRVVNLFDGNGHGDSRGFFVLWIRSLMLRRRTEMVTEIFIFSFLPVDAYFSVLNTDRSADWWPLCIHWLSRLTHPFFLSSFSNLYCILEHSESRKSSTSVSDVSGGGRKLTMLHYEDSECQHS